MRPFDLDAACAGAPVCTCAGACARIVCFDRDANYPIVALVYVDGVEDIKVYDAKGCYLKDRRAHKDDLLMRDNDSVDFIKCPAGPKGPEGVVFTDAGDIGLPSEFAPFTNLRKFIAEMASTGHAPSEWSEFIVCLASALSSSKESASGAASHAGDAPLSSAVPAASIPIDRTYWRHVYAAQALQGYVQSGVVNDDPSATYIAARCVALADAMLDRLEKF